MLQQRKIYFEATVSFQDGTIQDRVAFVLPLRINTLADFFSSVTLKNHVEKQLRNLLKHADSFDIHLKKVSQALIGPLSEGSAAKILDIDLVPDQINALTCCNH